MLDSVLAARSPPGSVDGPELCFLLNDLAAVKRRLRKLDEAASLAQRAIQASGTEHSDEDRILFRRTLLTITRSMGRIPEALEESQQLLTQARASLGDDNRITLDVMQLVSSAARRARATLLPCDVLTLEQELLSRRERLFGPTHMMTLSSRQNVAVYLARLNRIEEAIPMAREYVRLMTEAMGPEHPETLNGRVNLGTFLSESGHADEAIAELKELPEIFEKIVGPGNPDTFDAWNALGHAYGVAGNQEESLRCTQRSLELARTNLPPAHPFIRLMKANQAVELDRAGRHEEADELLRSAISDYVQNDGRDNPETILTVDTYLGILISSKRYADARALVKEWDADAAKTITPNTADAYLWQIRVCQVGAGLGEFESAEAPMVAAVTGLRSVDSKPRQITFALNAAASMYLEAWGKPAPKRRPPNTAPCCPKSLARQSSSFARESGIDRRPAGTVPIVRIGRYGMHFDRCCIARSALKLLSLTTPAATSSHPGRRGLFSLPAPTPYTRNMDTKPCLLAFLTLASLLLPACNPKVQVDIGRGPERELVASTVLTDENAGKAKVAMIDVRGLLADDERPDLFGQGINPVDRFVHLLELAEKDQEISAIIIRITSPGGTVTASDIMYRELRRFEKESHKPVVASLGEVAASGGYYLACGADRIVAEPTSITGSIGVIMPTINISQGLNSIGIYSRSVKSAANKDLGNPLEPMRDEQYAVLQHLVDEYFARFKGLVLERRPGIKPEDVATCTDGRVFSGEEAMKLGIVDEVGGIRESFAAAKKLANLSGATLVKYADKDHPARSIYALSNSPAAQPSAPPILRHVCNLHMDLGTLTSANPPPPKTSGVYYLWMQPANSLPAAGRAGAGLAKSRAFAPTGWCPSTERPLTPRIVHHLLQPHNLRRNLHPGPHQKFVIDARRLVRHRAHRTKLPLISLQAEFLKLGFAVARAPQRRRRLEVRLEPHQLGPKLILIHVPRRVEDELRIQQVARAPPHSLLAHEVRPGPRPRVPRPQKRQ